MTDALREKVAELEAENARLREALDRSLNTLDAAQDVLAAYVEPSSQRPDRDVLNDLLSILDNGALVVFQRLSRAALREPGNG